MVFISRIIFVKLGGRVNAANYIKDDPQVISQHSCLVGHPLIYVSCLSLRIYDL